MGMDGWMEKRAPPSFSLLFLHFHLGHADRLRALAREEEGLGGLVVRELGVGGGLE